MSLEHYLEEIVQDITGLGPDVKHKGSVDAVKRMRKYMGRVRAHTPRKPKVYHDVDGNEMSAAQFASTYMSMNPHKSKKLVQELKGGVQDKPEFIGRAIVDWINENMVIPETGVPVKLEQWQEEYIVEAFDSRDDDGGRLFDTAILSCGRKNAKSTLIAFVILAWICAPWAKSEQVLCGSVDRGSAKVIYRQMSLIISHKNWEHVSAPESRYKIVNKGNMSEAIMLSKDAKSSAAFIPTLIIIDELGYHPDRRLFDILDTSRGAFEPLMFVIGTRGHLTSPLNALIESAPGKQRTMLKMYAVSEDDDPFDEKLWYKANPGLGTIRSLRELREFAKEAKHDGDKLLALKSYYLNLPVDPGIETLFPDKQPWLACGVVGERSGECFAALDLSESLDPTAFVIYWKETGAILAHYFIPSEPPLKERAARDHLPYVEWEDDQNTNLTIFGRKVVDYVMLAKFINDCRKLYGFEQMAIDPWKKKAFEEACIKAKYLEDGSVDTDFKMPEIIDFAQGYKDMSPAIAALERFVVEGWLKHNNCPILTSAVCSAIIVRDGKLNRMFVKDKSYNRIDAAVAAAMACGLASRPKEIKCEFLEAWKQANGVWNG